MIAPSKIARRPGDRIKTDRRDALLLARAARAGELVSVIVPDERDEALRDLSRAREDAVRARFRARQQLKALLLLHAHRYTGRSSWTAAHERYLAEISFQQPAQDIAFAEYRSAVRDAHERVERLTEAMRSQLDHWRMRPVVHALMSLRGIARDVLVEAAWSYRFAARMSAQLQRRQEGQRKAVREIDWRAQLCLTSRYRKLSARKLALNMIIVAIARELSAFVWDIARQVKPANKRGLNRTISTLPGR